MKAKYITIPVLSVITALSLSSVVWAHHPYAASPTAQTFWVDNEIVYDCNGAGNCIGNTSQTSRNYGANARLVTPYSDTNKFIGWNLITYRLDKKNCEIWSGTSRQSVTKMPSTIGELKWNRYKQLDEKLCEYYVPLLLPYSSNLNDGISGAFFAPAEWEPYYTFTLYLNGGVVTGNIFKNVGSAVQVKYAESEGFKLPTPTKQGYKFVGWCTDKELSWCPASPNLYDGNFNKTYYARWEEKKKLQPIQSQKAKQINSKILNSITVK